MALEEKLKSDTKYLLSKVNFAASFLDAKAIRIMNSIENDIDAVHNEAFIMGFKKAKSDSYEDSVDQK
jgi:hypothetical protein